MEQVGAEVLGSGLFPTQIGPEFLKGFQCRLIGDQRPGGGVFFSLEIKIELAGEGIGLAFRLAGSFLGTFFQGLTPIGAVRGG